MSFFEQRLVNVFPQWSKIRKDVSSFGNRFITSFGSFSEKSTKDSVKIAQMFKILQEDISNGILREIFLDEADHIKVTYDGGSQTITYPTVTGSTATETIALTRAGSIEDFFYSMPSRCVAKDTINVKDWTIWQSSSPESYSVITTSERLLIEVSESTLYKRLKSRRATDKPFYGMHYVLLRGEDDDNNQISEILTIKDDGFYETKNIFRSLTSVEWDGFDGSIKITLSNKDQGKADTGRLVNKWSAGVNSQLSGPLVFYLKNTDSVGHLYSSAVRYLRGQQHRRAEIVDLDYEIEEELGNQRLLDIAGDTYQGVGIAMNPVDSRTYILDTKGKVHVYEPSLSPFNHRETAPTDDTYMDIISLKDRVVLNETIPLWTWFRALVLPVQKVVVKRVKPDGVEEYLQSDLTWSATSSYFSGDIIAGRLPEDSWEDFRFHTQFDQLGQWDFYCEATFLGMGAVTYVTKTGVMCESLQAVKTFDVVNGDGIFFDKENYLCISDGKNYHRYQLPQDNYMIDISKQRILFKELYESVEVTYE